MSLTLPLKSALPFVLGATRKHTEVSAAEQLDDFSLRVTRLRGLPAVTVVAVTAEMLEKADVEAILDAYPSIDGIVNSGKGTHYSGAGKLVANKGGVALHTFREYVSALAGVAFSASEDGLVRAAREAFDGHSKVEHVEQVCELRIRLHRTGDLAPIDFVPTAIYTLGIVQFVKVLEAHPTVDAVVNFNASMQYTPDAKEVARTMGIGLFTPREMFGALNYSDDAFRDYTPC